MSTLPSPLLVTFSPTVLPRTTIAATTTMAKRLRKPTLKVSENSALYATDDTIILGLEDPIVEPNQALEGGGAAGNSFKKVTFEQAAINVNRVYRGLVRVSHQQCKNKWQDLKSN
jgi:hypothetical protein